MRLWERKAKADCEVISEIVKRWYDACVLVVGCEVSDEWVGEWMT